MEQEQVKINDASAHLETLRSNIKIANLELTKALEARDNALAALPILEEERLALHKEIEKVNEDINSVERLLKSKQKKSRELDEECNSKLKNLEKSEAQMNARLNTLNVSIKELEGVVSRLSNNRKALITEIDSLEKTIKEYKDKEKQHKKVSDAARDKRLEDEARAKEFEPLINMKKGELADLIVQIEAEKKNLGVPKASLEEKEKAFAQKEKDFKTKVARLKKKWAIVYPGKSLNFD